MENCSSQSYDHRNISSRNKKVQNNAETNNSSISF